MVRMTMADTADLAESRPALDIVVRHLESIPGLTFVRPDAGYNLLINISALGVPTDDRLEEAMQHLGAFVEQNFDARG